MPLRDSVALVTGAAGFVGANLVRRLIAEGVRVHALVRPTTDTWRLADLSAQIAVHPVDLTDREAVREAVSRVRPDVVFHLAKHRGNPATLDYAAAYAANLDATRHLLDASLPLNLARFVHAGSSLEYDLTRSPLRESDAPAPTTVHGVTKAAATLLCQHYARQRGLPVVVLRLFTVYGPWEGPTRFVPRVMLAALDSRPVRVTREGLAHDWIFVDDVLEACVRSVSAPGAIGEILNVATGRQSTNEDVVAAIEAACGCRVPRDEASFPDRPWDTGCWVADVAKAADRLGWRAAVDLRAGLSKTFDWFSANLDAYRGQMD